MDVWSIIRDWFVEKVLDRIWDKIRTHNVSYQKLLVRLGLVFLAVFIICVWWHMVNDELTVKVTKSFLDQDGNVCYNEVYERSLPSILLIIAFVIDFVIWGAYFLLRIEKAQNAEKYRTEIALIREEKTNEGRGRVTENIRLAHTLLAYANQHDKSQIETEKWLSIQSNKTQLIGYRNRIVTKYFDLFDTYCRKIGTYIVPFIREKNPKDTVNISVKLFFEGAAGVQKVICLGKSINRANHQYDNDSVRRCSNWENLLKNSYSVADDYAMSLLIEPEKEDMIFRCGDVAEFTKTRAHISEMENDPKSAYHVPHSVKREFNATLVCPILVYTDLSDGAYRVVGAVCVDTTSSYTEWNASHSFEENVITYAASCIAPLIAHSMDDVSKIDEAIRTAA